MDYHETLKHDLDHLSDIARKVRVLLEINPDLRDVARQHLEKERDINKAVLELLNLLENPAE